MKVCIVTHEYPPNIASGPGTYAVNLVDGLISQGHEVAVITPRLMGGEEHEKKERLEIYRLDVYRSLFRFFPHLFDARLMFSLKMRRFKIDFKKFDLLHILDMHDSYFLDETPIPVIISVNDIYSFITPVNILKFPYPCTDRFKRYAFYMLTKILNKKYLKKADYVLANSKVVAQEVAKYCNIPNEKIGFVYKGIEYRKFFSAEGKYASQEILYVGGNMERKGVRYIIDALPYVFKKFPDFHFTAVGRMGSRLKKLLDEKIKKHELEKHVTPLPYASPEEILKYYAKANVFVLPRPIEQDLGVAQVLFEAMASGTPVVCSDDGSNLYGVGKGGIFVDTKNPEQIASAIIEIFANPEKAENMGDAGRERVEKIFNKDRMMQETLEVYQKVLKAF